MERTDCQRSTWLLFSKFLDSWLYGVKSGFGSQYGVPIAKLKGLSTNKVHTKTIYFFQLNNSASFFKSKGLSTNVILWTDVALTVSHVAAKHQVMNE